MISGTVKANGGHGGNGGVGGHYTIGTGVSVCDTTGTKYGFPGGGGGGGGAGGFIRLESGSQVVVTGTVEAIGGIGGQGGAAGEGILSPAGDYAGYAGGAGGGGRVSAFAPSGVEGLTASPGSDASGTNTPGQPSVYFGPRVDSISFTFSPPAGVSAGIPLAIDSDTPSVDAPEWQFEVKDKEPSGAAYDDETSAPAAFLVNQPIALQATFTASNNVTSAVIGATITSGDGSPSPFGSLPSQTVMFDGGHSVSPATYVSTDSTSILGAFDVKIRWKAESVVTANSTTTN